MAKEARDTFVSTIANRYGQRLKRFFALRVRNGADVPDLAQEVFLRLMRSDRHETIRSPEAYLFTIASHVLHQHTLRQASTPAAFEISELFEELQLTSEADPASDVETQQRLAELERALAELPAKMSTTLLLHRLSGLSIEEIGQRLGVSRPTAKKYLARALAHCRDVCAQGES